MALKSSDYKIIVPPVDLSENPDQLRDKMFYQSQAVVSLANMGIDIINEVGEVDGKLALINGVTLDVNNHITGYVQTNDGTTGNFNIVADNFNIINPTNQAIMLQYNAGAASLDVVGTMRLLNDVIGYANFNDRPLNLSAINSSEGSKLTGIEEGANATDLNQVTGAGNNLIINGDGLMVAADGRPAGLKSTHGSGVLSNISYLDQALGQIQLYNATDGTIGMGWPAFRVDTGTQYKIKLRVRAGAANVDGFFLRLSEYDGTDLPEGITHISNSANNGEAGVVEDTRFISSISNDPLPTTWTTYEITYTPSSTANWMSPVIRTAYDMGSKAVHVDYISITPIINSNADMTEEALNTTLDVSGLIRGINIEAESFKTSVEAFQGAGFRQSGEISLTERTYQPSFGYYSYGSGLVAEVTADYYSNSPGVILQTFESSLVYEVETVHGFSFPDSYTSTTNIGWLLDDQLKIRVSPKRVTQSNLTSKYFNYGLQIELSDSVGPNDATGARIVLDNTNNAPESNGLIILNDGGGLTGYGIYVDVTGASENIGAYLKGAELSAQLVGDAELSGNLIIDGTILAENTSAWSATSDYLRGKILAWDNNLESPHNGMWQITNQGGIALTCDSSLILFAGDNGLQKIKDNLGVATNLTAENLVLGADGNVDVYPGFQSNNGNLYSFKSTSTYEQIGTATGWLRSPTSGLLPPSPNSSGGIGALGTTSYRWYSTHTYRIYRNNEYAISDIRDKTNIKVISEDEQEDIVSRFKELEFTTYYRKENLKEKRFGLIAQQTKEHFPELVSKPLLTSPDFSEAKTEEDKQKVRDELRYHISGDVHFITGAVVQELIGRIEELEAHLNMKVVKHVPDFRERINLPKRITNND